MTGVRAGRVAAGVLLAAAFSGPAVVGDERAAYLAEGEDIRLFDHYDNDGYSLAVQPGAQGSVRLAVEVSDSPLGSSAAFPTGQRRDPSLPAAPERDTFAREAAGASPRLAEAVSRILVAVASRVRYRYDPERLRPQDPAAVFASGLADCVGFAELAVDLLRREGVRARTVQGILRTDPQEQAFDPRIGGSYHRWIEVYYPDRGWVFSDPSASINGVDARYIPFRTRSLVRPRSLTLVFVDRSGSLAYAPVAAGQSTLRERASARQTGGSR